jgi:hypothetical protein
MDSFIFINKGPVKKITPHKVMALFCLLNKDGLDHDNSAEDSTMDYETLVSQHKDFLYYSESEERIVEEGTAKICNRK